MATPLNINVDRYISLGDSLTAGYADGALNYLAQQHSYASIIAQQFKLLGGGDFKQPLIDPASVGINQHGQSRLVLKKNNNAGPGNLSLSFLAPQGDPGVFEKNIYKLNGPFNNLGVPGAKIISVLFPGYANPGNGGANFNPFFTRMAIDPATSSILSDAMAMNATFFSLFIGNNDALTYALSGGTEDAITPAFGPPGTGFSESLDFILNVLTANGAKGVIANIPDVMSVPFFTSVPYNGLSLSAEKAVELTRKYAAAGITFSEGKNSFLVTDKNNTLKPLKKDDVILLDILLDPDKAAFMSGEIPIPKKYTLFASEIANIQRAINEYNVLLESAAKTRRLAFVNINHLLKKTKKDRTYNSSTFNLEYRRGVFSLDGLHPNPLGHAMLANQFIKSINETYNLSIPFANLEPHKQMSFNQIERPL